MATGGGRRVGVGQGCGAVELIVNLIGQFRESIFRASYLSYLNSGTNSKKTVCFYTITEGIHFNENEV